MRMLMMAILALILAAPTVGCENADFPLGDAVSLVEASLTFDVALTPGPCDGFAVQITPFFGSQALATFDVPCIEATLDGPPLVTVTGSGSGAEGCVDVVVTVDVPGAEPVTVTETVCAATS